MIKQLAPEGVSKPLPLKGAYNVRDLGGYRTSDGRETRFGRFLRADGLSRLSPEDQTYLLERCGLRLVVDLRTPMEIHDAPDPFDAGVRWVNIPLADNVHSSGFVGKAPDSMADMYRDLLDNSGAMIKKAVEVMAREEGCVLFHCTAGKDRTGVLAMLLLKLANVPDEVVVRDYAATEYFMRPLFEAQLERIRSLGAQVPDYVFRSLPESMEETLAHLENTYGGSEGYLASLGVSQKDVEGIRNRLLK